MKKDMLKINKSSFSSMEKDLEELTLKILKNKELQKMLYYNTPDCLSQPYLRQEQIQYLLNNNILISPFAKVKEDMLNYIIITFDDFSPNQQNTYYRDSFLFIDILCHNSQWNLGDFKLRPYKIAGEIDGMINNEHFSGIGTLNFISANVLLMNDQIGGLTLVYKAIHGNDDIKKKVENN